MYSENSWDGAVYLLVKAVSFVRAASICWTRPRCERSSQSPPEDNHMKSIDLCLSPRRSFRLLTASYPIYDSVTQVLLG